MQDDSAAGRALVVICHYDARPLAPLVALLRQMRSVPAGAAFDVLVVVNSVSGTTPELPGDLAGTDLLMRQNSGYNLGAWQAGWRARPGHAFYLFLQDECELLQPGWLAAFQRVAARPATGLVGEMEVLRFTWRTMDRSWAEVGRRFEALRAGSPVPPRAAPVYLQTVVVAARGAVLERCGGFVEGDDKATAVAAEILTSVRLRQSGHSNRQLGYFPFSRIGHPQWQAHAAGCRTPRYALSRALRLALARGAEALGRLRRGAPPHQPGPARTGQS